MIVSRILKALEASKYRRQIKAAAGFCFGVARMVLSQVPGGQRCTVCNSRLICLSRPVMGEGLASEWQLDPTWCGFFDEREGQICVSCGASLRVRHLAGTIVSWLQSKGDSSLTIAAATKNEPLQRLRIAEINSCGSLHMMLKNLPHVSYSEYAPDDPAVRHEDLMDLSYSNESFDLVLHSDTLEHTPDVDKALAEIRRVLKPRGATIFTVPIVRDGRPTRVRAEIRDGTTHHILAPSYHGGSYQATRQYLVYYEFGEDFLARVSRAGFEVTLREHEENPAVATFVATKPALAGEG